MTEFRGGGRSFVRLHESCWDVAALWHLVLSPIDKMSSMSSLAVGLPGLRRRNMRIPSMKVRRTALPQPPCRKSPSPESREASHTAISWVIVDSRISQKCFLSGQNSPQHQGPRHNLIKVFLNASHNFRVSKITSIALSRVCYIIPNRQQALGYRIATLLRKCCSAVVYVHRVHHVTSPFPLAR